MSEVYPDLELARTIRNGRPLRSHWNDQRVELKRHIAEYELGFKIGLVLRFIFYTAPSFVLWLLFTPLRLVFTAIYHITVVLCEIIAFICININNIVMLYIYGWVAVAIIFIIYLASI